jgi:hypothetical protein
MPSLADHKSNSLVKVLYLGDAKSGKTTSLVSLVRAGYQLRILDLDNLLDSLKHAVLKECPDKIGNVEFRTLRDKYKAGPSGPVIDGVPKAFVEAMKMLDNWKYQDDNAVVEFGSPKSWGPNCILVIDSLSRLCDAAYDHHAFIAGPKMDGRAVYGQAQDAVEMVLAGLTGDSFETNVIVICHGVYMSQEDGKTKIFPQGVGQKLSPKIPQYFPVYIRLKNSAGKRVMQIESDVMIDLAMPGAEKFQGKTLEADTGLGTIFKTLLAQPVAQSQPAATVVAKPKAVVLQRRV